VLCLSLKLNSASLDFATTQNLKTLNLGIAATPKPKILDLSAKRQAQES
jgi:hypothetical protein